MDFSERLNVLQAAEGDPALLVLATVELAHSELPMEERESIRRALLAAAVPHWFDPAFLGALLAVDEQEAERLYGKLCTLRAVEPFSARGERAVNVHESVRLALREHLRQSDPEQWRALSERARAHVATSSSVHARIEALHHHFAIDQEVAAVECQTLDRDLMQKPEWRQALAISLSELSYAGWLRGPALVESLLIPLQARSQRGENARLEAEVSAVVELAERYDHSSGLARAQCLIGDVYKEQGRRDAAIASFQKSVAIQEQLVKEDPSNTGWQRDLAVAHSRFGDMYLSQGRRDEALFSFLKDLAILQQLVLEDPSNTGWQHDLGVAHSRMGHVYRSQGRRDEAIASFQKYVAIQEQLVKEDPSNTGWQHSLGVSLSSLGDVYRSQGRRDAALASFQKSLAILERLVQDDPSNARWQRDLAIAHLKLGDVFQSQGRRDVALAFFQKSLAILEPVAQVDPSNANWQRELDAIKVRLGKVSKRRGHQHQGKGFFEPGEQRGSKRKQ
jgi:tetratricopeptide (TPR) repeat protein